MRPNPLAVVLALNVCLAAALALLWSDPDRGRWSEPEALPPSLDEVVAAPPPEPADVSRYRETIERPLFASSRKMAPRRDPGAEAQEAVDPLQDVRLLGTYGAGGRGGVIVINGGKVQRVPVGESIGGWTVVGEEGRGAALVRASGERRKLELALNNTAPTAPSAAGKEGGPDANQAAAGQARSAGAAQPGASRRAAGQGTTAESKERGQAFYAEMERRRIENINARRARKGLPPLTQQ